MATVIETIERAQLRRVPNFAPGDRVKVHFQVIEGTRKRVQVFEGVVIKRQGHGVRETFTVRKQSFGVGVERMFPVHSPKIERIEMAARGDVRRAKLYYLRDRVGKRARVRERRWSAADAERFGPDGATELAAAAPQDEPSAGAIDAEGMTAEGTLVEGVQASVEGGAEPVEGAEPSERAQPTATQGAGTAVDTDAATDEAAATAEPAVDADDSAEAGVSGGTEASADEVSAETESETSGADQSSPDAGDSQGGDDAGTPPA